MLVLADYLSIGREHAKTGKDLAYMLNCDPRDISKRIEAERRQGKPICATCDGTQPGYYLAATADELQKYCDGLHKRAGEIYKTRRALLKTADEMRQQEA